MGFLRVIGRILTSRITLGLALLLGLGALIWFAGPKLRIEGAPPLASQMTRIVLIGALALLFIAFELLRRWRLHRLNQRILSDLNHAQGESAPTPGGHRVREGFATLCDALRTQAGGQRAQRRHLRGLAWYLMLGESGSGRTSALNRSGLDFPLEMTGDPASPSQAQHAGGYCGWRATDEAVLIDAPGDFIDPAPTESEIASTESEWADLLRILRSVRRRLPLSGVILALSAEQFLEGRFTMAAADRTRHRLNDIQARFRAQLPVYVLVTQCDRVAGFTDYFADLDLAQRERPLGFKLPLARQSLNWSLPWARNAGTGLDLEGPLAAFGEHYRHFTRRLTDWAPLRFASQRQPDGRRRVFGFPQRMQALGMPLETALHRIFPVNRFGREPLLRGIYFCSAMQRGQAVDVLMQAHAQAWRLTPPAPQPSRSGPERPYFIKGLLREVLLPERHLARRDEPTRRRHLLAFGTGCAGALAAAFGLWTSWSLASDQAERQAHKVAATVDAYQQERDAPQRPHFAEAALTVSALRPMERPVDAETDFLRTAAAELGAEMLGAPGALNDRVGQAYRSAGRFLVRPAVVRDVGAEVAGEARAGSGSQRLADLLRLYMGIGDPERLDVDALARWAENHAEGRYPLNSELQAAVTDVVRDAFTELDQGEPIDPAVVAAARHRLYGGSLAARLYGQLKSAPAGNGEGHPPVALGDALGRNGATVFAAVGGGPLPKVPGFFSELGFYERFLPDAPRHISEFKRDDWMLGDAEPPPSEMLFEDMGTLYARDYIAAWHRFLDGLRLRRITDPEAALRLLDALLSPDAPLDALADLVAVHTMLPVVRGSEGAASEPTADAAPAAELGAIDSAAEETTGKWPGKPIRQAFAAYRHLRDGDTGELPGLTELRNGLAALRDVLAALSSEPDFDAAAFTQVRAWVAQPAQAETTALLQAAESQPRALRRMLEGFAGDVVKMLLVSVRRHIGQRWQADVVAECRRAIADRYPISRHAQTPVAPDDFERFFAGDGTMSTFFDELVRPFVGPAPGAGTRRSPWRERGLNGQEVGFAPSALAAFRNAHGVRDAFGLAGGSLSQLGFNIEPLYLDDEAVRVRLHTGQGTVTYRHEPPRRFRMSFVDQSVAIGLADRSGVDLIRREEGPWAWFRVFDRFELRPTQAADRFELAVAIDGLEATFDLSADSVQNPLSSSAVTDFRCEERLL